MNSLEQREESLRQANRVRLGRAAILRELRTYWHDRTGARKHAVGLLRDLPPELEKCRLGLFLCSLPGVGYVGAGTMANRAGAGLDRRMGALTCRQRAVLIDELSPDA